MLEALRKRIDRDEEGFTLIELMVVVLIIAILIAIAIPTFLGAQNRARDRAAQSNLRNAITAAKTLATDHEGKFLNSSGTAIGQSDMSALEPSITFGTAAVGVVQVTTDSAGANIVLFTKSASNEFFGIGSDSDGRVKYCRGTAVTNVNAYSGCTLTKW